MRCGDKGFIRADGQPCMQPIPSSAVACVWHSRTKEERSLFAAKGAGASLMKAGMATKAVLPASTPAPSMGTAAEITEEIRVLIHRVLTGQLDPRRGEVALGALMRVRAERVESEPQTRPVPQVLTWRLPFCDNCTCPTCTKNRGDVQRMHAWNPDIERRDEARPPTSVHLCPSSPDGKHVVMPRADEWPPAAEGAMFWCESCDQRVRLRESDDGARIVHGAQDETPEEAAAAMEIDRGRETEAARAAQAEGAPRSGLHRGPSARNVRPMRRSVLSLGRVQSRRMERQARRNSAGLRPPEPPLTAA